MLAIQILLTEIELAAEFVAAFEARRLPEKFFYWLPLSVRSWLALCSDGAYRNFARSHSLIVRTAPDVAQHLGPEPLDVLSLGAGQGDKDLLLLEALRERDVPVTYLPVDSSQALLEMACAGALRAGFAARGVKADFTRPEQLLALGPEPQGPRRLVLMLGNTLGAFDPLAEAHELGRLLRPGDALLVDGELYAGDSTIAGYDNPLNRQFAWAPLHAVGIGEVDGELAFDVEDDPRLPGLHRLSKHFRATRALEARLGGEALRIGRGERLEMSHSYKYTPDTFHEILARAGLTVAWEQQSEDERFLMVLAGPA